MIPKLAIISTTTKTQLSVRFLIGTGSAFEPLPCTCTCIEVVRARGPNVPACWSAFVDKVEMTDVGGIYKGLEKLLEWVLEHSQEYAAEHIVGFQVVGCGKAFLLIRLLEGARFVIIC